MDKVVTALRQSITQVPYVGDPRLAPSEGVVTCTYHIWIAPQGSPSTIGFLCQHGV